MPRTRRSPCSPNRDSLCHNALSQQESQIGDLIAFKQLAMSRIAAQHLEIERLREQAAGAGNVRRLPAARTSTAPFGSCS